MTVPATETATFAGGCFWCLEPLFKELRGVLKVTPGYSGGAVPHPSYELVCMGTTGHAESVQVEFDPSVISYKELLEVFFTMHDPTTLNRQGADVGTQYRSAVFYHAPEQQKTVEQVIRDFEAKRVWDGRFVTEVKRFDSFYPAEDYHHDYFASNPWQPYCRIVIAPKVAKFRKQFLEKLRR